MKNKEIIDTMILIVAVISLTITSYFSLQNIEISKINTELTKNLIEKKPDFSIILPSSILSGIFTNTRSLVLYGDNGFLPCSYIDNMKVEPIKGNLTLINTGYRPIVLSNQGTIYEQCPNSVIEDNKSLFGKRIIGSIITNQQILEVERTLNLEYFIDQYSTFPAKNCSIIFSISSYDGKIIRNENYTNVEIQNCR